jgi:hypothetical protein
LLVPSGYGHIQSIHHDWETVLRELFPEASTRADATQDEPTGFELIFIILNYVFVVPVTLVVGGFRYCMPLYLQNHNELIAITASFMFTASWSIPRLLKAGRKTRLQRSDDTEKLKK